VHAGDEGGAEQREPPLVELFQQQRRPQALGPDEAHDADDGDAALGVLPRAGLQQRQLHEDGGDGDGANMKDEGQDVHACRAGERGGGSGRRRQQGAERD